jgi:hypothetical protein
MESQSGTVLRFLNFQYEVFSDNYSSEDREFSPERSVCLSQVTDEVLKISPVIDMIRTTSVYRYLLNLTLLLIGCFAIYGIVVAGIRYNSYRKKKKATVVLL